MGLEGRLYGCNKVKGGGETCEEMLDGKATTEINGFIWRGVVHQ